MIGPDHQRGAGQVHPEAADEAFEEGGESDPGAETEGRADQAERQPFDQHHAGDLPAAGAQRAQQAELSGAGGDEHREGVEDQEDADHHGDAGEAEQGVGDDVEEGADLGGAGLGLFLSDRDGVALPEHGL